MGGPPSNKIVSWFSCGITALVACTIVGGVLAVYLLRPNQPADVADRYFKLLGTGKTVAARDLTTAAYQKRVPGSVTELQLKSWGFDSYTASSWPNVTIENDEATLEGAVENSAHEAIPLIVKLVRESRSWRIQSIDKPEDPDPGWTLPKNDGE
jgi:hypothetical protein